MERLELLLVPMDTERLRKTGIPQPRHLQNHVQRSAQARQKRRHISSQTLC
jgi:hypothetical protein